MKDPQKAQHPSAESEPARNADVMAAARQHPETDWRHFPQFERSFDTPDAAKEMFTKIEKTCEQLERFRTTGTPREKSRAQAAMRAYGRTVELIRHLEQLRAAKLNTK